MSAAQDSGLIGCYNLTSWWIATFSPSERALIESEYIRGRVVSGQPAINPLTSGRYECQPVSMNSITCARLLHEIACAAYPSLREQALSVFRKAENEALANVHLHTKFILDLHFIYHSMIKLNYRDRTRFADALSEAVGACSKQIALAPRAAGIFRNQWKVMPSHLGFSQMVVILEKRGEYEEALRLSAMALEQGWSGTWEKRTARLQRRITRSK